MRTSEIDRWFSKILHPEYFESIDPSKNGLQVDNNNDEISCVAFAVDACNESIERASFANAGMLFVHHGLFWNQPTRVTGMHYRRLKILFEKNIALYACHLPLDAHPEIGHNAGIASRLQLINIEPFGSWRGIKIGYKGHFENSTPIDSILGRLFPDGKQPITILPFGPERIKSVGIISGGASDEVSQAISENLDLYITGEISHEAYHTCLENKISVIAGGHYQTETIGLKLLAKKFAFETGINTVFLDIPTGL